MFDTELELNTCETEILRNSELIYDVEHNNPATEFGNTDSMDAVDGACTNCTMGSALSRGNRIDKSSHGGRGPTGFL